MYEKQYSFRLQGISPLIMHWDNIEWSDQISAERDRLKEDDKKNFKAGDDRFPPHTWKGYLYNDGQHIALPHDNLRSCLVRAATKIPFQNRESYKSLCAAAVIFDDIFQRLLVNGKQIPMAAIEKIKGTYAEQATQVRKLGFELLAKRASVNQTKHVRVRPKFNNWTVEGTITVVDEQITGDVLQKIFALAGPRIALCDWRPGSPKSPGPYGRFGTELKAA